MVVEYTEKGGVLVTPCPHGMRRVNATFYKRVNSAGCKHCKYYGGQIDNNSINCKKGE